MKFALSEILNQSRAVVTPLVLHPFIAPDYDSIYAPALINEFISVARYYHICTAHCWAINSTYVLPATSSAETNKLAVIFCH